MLKTKDLIENIDEKYVPMLKQVNIPDFTKCIATLAWKEMVDIRDDVIKRYLLQWAESKYRFYQMLGNKIKVDCPFTYNRLKSETKERLINLKQEFPAYIPWIEVLRECSANKLTNREMSWELRKWICEGFPQFKYEGSSITRFFKSCLGAPDTLVNRLAQVFENSTVDATYTISIDPVDIMLASESPYDWSSCYKLDPRDEGNHADGCLAALIDSSSLITYVWNKEGEYQLDASHLKFKSIRYKKMRAWISISPDFNAFYMNHIYPGKGEYGEDFEKKLRVIIEKNISDYVKLEDKWMPQYDSLCYRKYPYGYDEYSEDDRTYIRLGFEDLVPNWTVFDVRVKCPCGCGLAMPGFYDSNASNCDYTEYNGGGYGCQGIKEEHYCEYLGDYCDCDPEYDDDCCYDCYYWQQAHPRCPYDTDEECSCYNSSLADVHEVDHHHCVCANSDHCDGCDIWREAHPVCELDRDEECPFYSEDSDEIEKSLDDNGVYIEACGDYDHCSRCRIWQEKHKDGEDEEEAEE
jgi:hypothetical protein